MNILSQRVYKPKCIYLNVLDLYIKYRVYHIVFESPEFRYSVQNLGFNFCLIRTNYTIFNSDRYYYYFILIVILMKLEQKLLVGDLQEIMEILKKLNSHIDEED